MVEPKNTYTMLEFENGEEVKLSLAYYLLYQLKPKEKDLYDRYNKIMTKGPAEELDMVVVLYTGYRCANLDSQTVYSELEFMMLLGDDREKVAEAFKAVMGKSPKKPRSVTRS